MRSTFDSPVLIFHSYARAAFIKLRVSTQTIFTSINPLNAELNPICHLLALLGAHHNFHVSGLRVKFLKEWYCILKVVEKLSVSRGGGRCDL